MESGFCEVKSTLSLKVQSYNQDSYFPAQNFGFLHQSSYGMLILSLIHLQEVG